MDPYEPGEVPDQTNTLDFEGGNRRFFWISLVVGVYSSIAVYLIFAITRYLLLGDNSVFNLGVIPYLVGGCIAYVALSFRTMRDFDGQKDDGTSWVTRRATVKLIETRNHKRFG